VLYYKPFISKALIASVTVCIKVANNHFD